MLWHHWPTLGALGALWVSGGSTPAAIAPELVATGLAIEYNEALWAALQLWRPTWLQKLHVLVRTSVFPPLLIADVLTYTRIMRRGVARLLSTSSTTDGSTRVGIVKRLLIVQFVVAMAIDHAKNFHGCLRLCEKLLKGKFKVKQ